MIDVWKEKVTLYKDMVTEIPKSIQPTSATWAKKHIFGFSDEDIKLEVQQIRLERAVSAELDNTATIITHTGLFDNVDKLYHTSTGTTENAGGAPPDPGAAPDMGGGAMPPPPPDMGGDMPVGESKKDNLNILLENDNILGDTFIDLSKGRNSLGSMEDQLNKLLND
jgi:hypothetical protein